MITCPMCKKSLPDMEQTCRNCKADVSLLVDYVSNLDEGLRLAEQLMRDGELGEAVWAYLAVLEVDPDNATARRQVGKVATAVRQFDNSAPGRRWLKQLKRRKGFARWLQRWKESEVGDWLSNVLWFAVIIGVLLLGYALGYWTARHGGTEPTKTEEVGRTSLVPGVSGEGAGAQKPEKTLQGS
jgi:hypothetical protein